MLRAIILATTALVSLGAAANAYAASPFNGFVVFGDSLSDAGDLSLSEGATTPMRFTTNPGLVSAQYIAEHYGLTVTPSLQGGTDFAYGGAGVLVNSPGTPANVPLISTQIANYLTTNTKLSSTSIYSVLGGPNDIFYHQTSEVAASIAAELVAAETVGLSPAAAAAVTQQIDAEVEQVAQVSTLETSAQATAGVNAAASKEVALIGQLKAAGAHYILVYNLPDIGTTPSATSEGPAIAASLTALSNGFNSILNTGLAGYRTDIVPVNTYAVLKEVLASPAAYGFTNTTTPACTTASSQQCTPATLVAPGAASTYVFADGVHPTTAMQMLISQYVVAEMSAPQQESLLGEAPLGFLDGERGAIQHELLYDDAQDQLGVRLFATGGYASQQFRANDDGTPHARDNGGLITAGVDWRMSPAMTLGAEVSGAESTTSLTGGVGRFDADAAMGSIFGQYQWRHRLYVNGAIGFGEVEYRDVQRTFKLGADTRVEHGNTEGNTYDANLTVGYWFGPQTLHTGPYASAIYEHVRVEPFSEESGDSSAMDFAAQAREAAIGEVGWKLQATLPTPLAVLYPYASVGYDYDADARTNYVTAGLTTMSGTFAMPGYTPARNWGVAEVGLDARFAHGVSAFAGYHGRYGAQGQQYDGVDVGLKYSF